MSGSSQERTLAGSAPTLAAFLSQSRRLLDARRAQRGRPTFGDEHDRALVAAAGALRADARGGREALAEAGRTHGREVFARCFFEDSMRGAVIVLSTCLLESGWGTLGVESTFHREALLSFRPSGALSASDEALVDFVGGVVEGYMGAAFNCRARASAAGAGLLEVRLLEGRDVNLRGGAP